MAVCTATFEAGVNGNTITTAGGEGSATPWDAVDVSGGTIKYDNTHSYGLLSSNFVSAGNPAAAVLSWSTAFGTQTDHYGRLYLWMNSNPTGASLRLLTTNPIWIAVRLTTAGILSIQPFNGGGVDLTNAISLGQWVRIEWHMIQSTTVGQVEIKLFNNANSSTPTETQATAANLDTGANVTGIDIGSGSGASTTATFWLDNIVAGATSYPGPASTPAPDVLSMQSHVFGHGVW